MSTGLQLGTSLDFALTESNGIRRFSDKKLQSAIDAAIARRKPDRPLVVVAHADGEKAYLSAAYHAGNEWTIVAAAYKDYDEPFRYGAEVVWTPDF